MQRRSLCSYLLICRACASATDVSFSWQDFKRVERTGHCSFPVESKSLCGITVSVSRAMAHSSAVDWLLNSFSLKSWRLRWALGPEFKMLLGLHHPTSESLGSDYTSLASDASIWWENGSGSGIPTILVGDPAEVPAVGISVTHLWWRVSQCMWQSLPLPVSWIQYF